MSLLAAQQSSASTSSLNWPSVLNLQADHSCGLFDQTSQIDHSPNTQMGSRRKICPTSETVMKMMIDATSFTVC
ncbi:hypothetical protein LOK49_LG04G01863 [Camellia lanceoleosa]|uniref:Uncharacterized protein n=1 Tax=Camellia lanceoleosa TaxID=1840588 RepID=A0ACC0I1J5_9ERIC|nr:hypothetical protein LOK49_LG04G01863 [Camellia lanceoleosa]